MCSAGTPAREKLYEEAIVNKITTTADPEKVEAELRPPEPPVATVSTWSQTTPSPLKHRHGWPSRLRSYFILNPLIWAYTIILGTLSLFISFFYRNVRLQHNFARFWSWLVMKTILSPVRVTGRTDQLDNSKPRVYAVKMCIRDSLGNWSAVTRPHFAPQDFFLQCTSGSYPPRPISLILVSDRRSSLTGKDPPPMKNPYDVLKMKEQELIRVRREMDALRIAAHLLAAEDPDASKPESQPKRQRLVEMP